MLEKDNVEAPVAAAKVEAKVEPKTSSAPAPGTPEFAAWAWENRNG